MPSGSAVGNLFRRGREERIVVEMMGDEVRNVGLRCNVVEGGRLRSKLSAGKKKERLPRFNPLRTTVGKSERR